MTSAQGLRAPAHWRVLHSLDSQEHAGELSGWEQDYEQISRGAFRSRLVEIDIQGVQLFQEELSQAVFQTGCSRADTVTLGVFSALSGEARWHGGAVGLDDVLCVEGCGELVLTTPRTSCLLAVGVPLASLEHWFEAGRPPEGAQRLHGRPLRDGQAAARLRRQLTRVIAAFVEHGESAMPPRVMSALHEELSLSVAELLHGAALPGALRAGARAKQVVRRAREYALDRRDDPPGLPEVCRHAFVSARTLQNCFEAVLGESPATYLKILRLNGARRELLEKGPEARVSDVAANWGFWHLSQFAADYRRMFGELPSRTRAPAGACDRLGVSRLLD